MQPESVYVQGSCNSACALLLGVTCFSVSPEMGDSKHITVAASQGAYRRAHGFPLPPREKHKINFPNYFKAVMDLSTFCQSCCVCKKCYKWLCFQKSILLLLSVLNAERSEHVSIRSMGKCSAFSSRISSVHQTALLGHLEEAVRFHANRVTLCDLSITFFRLCREKCCAGVSANVSCQCHGKFVKTIVRRKEGNPGWDDLPSTCQSRWGFVLALGSRRDGDSVSFPTWSDSFENVNPMVRRSPTLEWTLQRLFGKTATALNSMPHSAQGHCHSPGYLRLEGGKIRGGGQKLAELVLQLSELNRSAIRVMTQRTFVPQRKAFAFTAF